MQSELRTYSSSSSEGCSRGLQDVSAFLVARGLAPCDRRQATPDTTPAARGLRG